MVVRTTRNSAARSRAVFNRRTAAFLTLVICAVFALALLRPAPVLPAAYSTRRPVAVEDWRSCNRDAGCCERLLSPAERPHRVVNASLNLPAETGGGKIAWRMAVHPDYDIVSGKIQATGSWDTGKSMSILSALHAAGPRAILLDVGANIGWFTLAIAAAGRSVVAVEPFAENLALLRHSLCLAPQELSTRVQVLPYALGSREGMQCQLWQNKLFNRGDTYTVCDVSAASPSLAALRADAYKKLGEAHVRRLDVMVNRGEANFESGRPIVMKVDVEGFEGQAMAGAPEFLAKYKPGIIFAEYAEKMIRQAAQTMGASVEASRESPRQFLDYMTMAGYSYEIQKGTVDTYWGPVDEAIFTRKAPVS